MELSSEILFVVRINFQESICAIGGIKNTCKNLFTDFTEYLILLSDKHLWKSKISFLGFR